MKPSIEISDSPHPDDLKFIFERLQHFNDEDAGPAMRRSLAVFVRSENGNIVAGLSGNTAWGWLYVQWLWVEQPFRGRNIAGQMLKAAEAEARLRHCHGALIDTFNPKALKVYERCGYKVFGTLQDFPIGRSRSYLFKALS